MLDSVVRFVIISVIIIVVMHSLYSFLVKNLTIPRVKDLVHKPQTQYENIFKSITSNNNDSRVIDELGSEKNKLEEGVNKQLSENQIEMKNELKSYIKDLKASRQRNNSISQGGDIGQASSVFDKYDNYTDFGSHDNISRFKGNNNTDSNNFMDPLSASAGSYENMSSLY